MSGRLFEQTTDTLGRVRCREVVATTPKAAKVPPKPKTRTNAITAGLRDLGNHAVELRNADDIIVQARAFVAMARAADRFIEQFCRRMPK